MKNKLLKIALALLMTIGVLMGGSSSVSAAEVILPDGTYEVTTQLKNAGDIEKDSMAAGALASKGQLSVEKGQWYLITEWKTLDFGGMGSIFGNASDICYYESDTSSTKHTAAIISYRDDATVVENGEILKNQRAVKEVKMPIAVNAQGVYINMYVDFMNSSPDAYVRIDGLEKGIQKVLTQNLQEAKGYQENLYTSQSWENLQKVIEEVSSHVESTQQDVLIQGLIDLQNAMNSLQKREDPLGILHLKDGTYDIEVALWHASKDQASMAASIIKSSQLIVHGTTRQLQITTQPMTMMGMTAELEKLEYETGHGTYATATQNDGVFSFDLPTTEMFINVKVHYMGHGQTARLKLVKVLKNTDSSSSETPSTPSVPSTPSTDESTTTQPNEETTTAKVLDRFEKDGTYRVHVYLWNASQDQPSMAASAIIKEATVIVKDNQATMYINGQKMTMGTISAYLQELKIKQADGSYQKAEIYAKYADGNPQTFMFQLPSGDEMIQVLVNPHVAMMGNTDIEARLKIDYTSLQYISASTSFQSSKPQETIRDDKTNESQTVNEQQNHSSKVTVNKPVQTSDTTALGLMGGLFVISTGLILILRKKYEV